MIRPADVVQSFLTCHVRFSGLHKDTASLSDRPCTGIEKAWIKIPNSAVKKGGRGSSVNETGSFARHYYFSSVHGTTDSAKRLSIPFTVMGGIKERHLRELAESGAGKIAMVTEITLADDIAQRVRSLRRSLNSVIARNAST
jgi:hypothetical protein